jgi:hypothetical protein
MSAWSHGADGQAKHSQEQDAPEQEEAFEKGHFDLL